MLSERSESLQQTPFLLTLAHQFFIHTPGTLPASLRASALSSPWSGKLFPQIFTADSLASFKSAQISPFQWGPLLHLASFLGSPLFPPWHLPASNMLCTLCAYLLPLLFITCLPPLETGLVLWTRNPALRRAPCLI